MSLLGSEIKRIRMAKNKNQKTVAALMEVSAQYLSNVEKGKCVMAPDRLKSISKILRVKQSTLINLAVEDYRNTFTAKIK
ncbi:MAG: helix-turn-helix transcriptional regulator [bacterium]|nr:helix-turn-helix transcriptional regulator [bacterium]